MANKRKIEKEYIIDKALDFIRKQGFDALTARNLAKEIHISTQPIYLCFKNMDELKETILLEIKNIYQSFLRDMIESKKYPVYKCYGMGYIEFAYDEPELFKTLFMRKRDIKKVDSLKEKIDIQPIIAQIVAKNGFSEEEANLFHLHMWIYIHGFATQVASGYLMWSKEDISNFISVEYNALLKYFKQEEISKCQ